MARFLSKDNETAYVRIFSAHASSTISNRVHTVAVRILGYTSVENFPRRVKPAKKI
jgi:hypothetical protein